jgi:hypothetical protein
MKRAGRNIRLGIEEKCLTTKGGSTLRWITLTTLIFSSHLSLFPPFLSPSLSLRLSLQIALRKMVRAKPKPEELDIKPFSQNSKTQDTKGAGRGEKWSGEDRRALFIYVERHGAGNWTAAAESVPGKSAKQVHCPYFIL